MKFYILDDPATPDKYAMLSHVGTWTDGDVCDVCGVSTARLVEPLQVEWEEGTDRIGDFSWCGYTCVVVDEVRAFLKRNTFEAQFGRVDVMPPSERPKRPRRPRVRFPYCGPQLSWLVPTARLQIDERRSGIRLSSDCPKCRQKRFTFKRDGLVVPARAWCGQKLFLATQFDPSGATFITEEGLSMLVDAGFSNLCPHLAGLIDS